ncbi:MAG: hypothetical protein LIP23_02025 [Planctomycetes bacterium]|nr:hypothetical protein [Planctomycetota bacterium]
MFIESAIYKVKQSFLYIGDVVLTKSGRTPGCARCGDVKPRLGYSLCASQPPIQDVDIIPLVPSRNLPGATRRTEEEPAFLSITPADKDSRLPPESLLHRNKNVAQRYIVVPGGEEIEDTAQFFTPNGIPIYYRRASLPINMDNLSISPEEIFTYSKAKGGNPYGKFLPSGGAYAHTKKNSGDIACFLRDFPGGQQFNSTDYAFIVAHWAIAFGRGIA